MPIYNYRCKSCGYSFEFLMINKKEKPKCPKCGRSNLQKLPTAFGVRIGSGSDIESSSGSCPTGTCPITGGE